MKPSVLRVFGLVLIILFLAASNSSGNSATGTEPESKAEADASKKLQEAWTLLSDYYKKPGSIDESIRIAEGVLQAEPNNIDALLFISRAWLTYGYIEARTKDELIRAFENGMKEGEKAVKLKPDNPDAHFFYVANLASLGDTKGLFNSLFMLPEIRRELDTILKLDPNHPEGLAMNGALYFYLPGLLGGDIHISEIYLERSLNIDPHLSSARLYLAANYIKQKKFDDAMEQLRLLLDDKKPSFYPDWRENRKYALRMMEGIEAKTDAGKEVKK